MSMTDEQADKVIAFMKKKKELRGKPPVYPVKGIDPKFFVGYWHLIVSLGDGDPIKAAERDYEINVLKIPKTDEEKAKFWELSDAYDKEKEQRKNRQSIIDGLID